jgi:type IV secretory pathway TraG/TraD family ATPase VirD4
MKKLISEIPFLVWLLISLIWINNRDLILRGKFILTIVWTGIILWIWYRFFRKKEVRAIEPKSDQPLLETPDSFVIPLKDNGPLHLRNIQNGIMIIGQPGSGKTASIIHPILYQVINKDWTGLVYDLKGKLGDEVISCYDSIIDKSNQKTALKFINFSNPFKSDRVNPISPSYLNNKAEALDFVGTLLSNLMANDGSKSEDPFWFNNAKNIFTSIVWFLKNNHPQFCTLPHAIALVYADPDALIRLLQSDEESSRLLSTLRASSEAKDKKLFVNILSTLYTHLMALDLPELFWVLSGDEVNLNVNSKENPTLLTIANHEPLQKVYSPIIAVICNVVTQRMNEEGKLKGVILFDEFASIKIPNFERIPETIRSRGVSTVIALHDKQQLITKYGESIAETIASTLATKFYFKSTNSKTVYEAVKILGKRDTRFNTKSQSTADGVQGQTNTVGMSETLQERDYLRIDEITNYDRGEFAGIFSDANIKYTKNQTVLLRELASRSAVPIRNDVTTEKIDSNYKKVYQDIEELFKNDSYDHQPSAEEIKIDF